MDGSNPPLGEAILKAGLEEVEEYIMRIQNKVAQCIVMWTITDLCEE